ncbi:hypothetical protein FBU30_005558 [Linnemannia zychae]|nr:hypothetical protein FBU30_005558 [Linnemannia zychae]
MPAATANVTFGSTDTPGSIILGGLNAMVPKPKNPAAQYLVPGMVNITNVGVFINSSTTVTIHAGASLKNPFGNVAMPLGNVGLKVSLDGHSIANITTSNLTIPGGIAPVDVTATIQVADGNVNPAVQASINNLVATLVGGNTPSGPPPTITVSDVSLGGNPLGTAPISLTVEPIGISPPTAPVSAPAPASPPVVGLSGIINPNITLAWPTLNKVVAKAVTGAQLTAGVGFSWNNPLNIEIDIPYISVDFGLNGTRIATIGVHAIHLAPGPMTADTLIDLKFNNDPNASIQLAAFVNDFLAGELHQIINIGNLAFGNGDNSSAVGTILNTLFSGVQIDIPVMGVNTTAIQSMVMGLLKPYISFPIDISTLGATGPSLLQYIQSLAVSTAPGHTLLIQPKIQVPFPFILDLSIPYLALDINLNSNLLGQLFITDLVGSGQGQVLISTGIGIVFKEPNPAIPAAVAELVNGVTTGSPIAVTAGISNLAIGISPSDAVNTLNGLNIAVPVSSVITGKIDTGNLIQTVIAQTNITIAQNTVNVKVGTLAELTIYGASINVLPNNLVTAAIKLEMFLGVPVVANIGYLGIQAQLDGAQLAGISLNTGVNYAGGRVQMDAGIALNIGTGPTISSNVAALVNAIISKQTVTSIVGISGIVIGNSPTDVINALSGISVQLPLGGLFGGSALPTLPDGFLNSTVSQLGLTLADLSLATIPGAGLRIGAKATFSNPIPISVSVPYIGVSGGLDNVDLATVGINNLALVPGANSLGAQVDLNFNNAAEAQTKIATFLGEILRGQLGSTPELLTVHNLRIGVSPSDYFDLLSQVNVAVPSKDIINKANLDLITSKLGNINITQIASNLLSTLEIGGVSADLTQAPIMNLGATVSVSNISLNAAVNIGYFGIDLALDAHNLAHIDVPSISITTTNNKLTLAIQAAITLQDTPEIQTDIANLVNYFMANSTTSPITNLVISRPLIGVSASDNIQTLALIKYPLAVSPLLLQAKGFINKLLAGVGGLNLNNLGLSGLVLDLNSPSVIGVQGGIQIKNITLPATINIKYIGVSIGLDDTPLASLTIPQLSLASADNSLSINFQAAVDVKQTSEASGQVAKLVGALLSPGQVTPPTALVISQPVFGGDANHLFHILSQVKIGVALAPYLQTISNMLNGAAAGSSNLLAGLDIGSLVVDLNSPQVIGIDAAISLKNITIPAEIKLNYVGVNIAVNTVSLAQIAIPSFTLKPADGALAITAHVNVAMLTSPELTSAISGLVNGIINNQTTPATNLVISGAVFGGSPTNVFTILEGIAIPINVSPFIAQIGGALGGAGSLLSGLGLSGLAIDLNQAPVIGIDANVAIRNLVLPAKVNLGYLGLSVGINDVPLLKVALPKLTLGQSGNDFTVSTHIDATLQETDASKTLVAGLVDTIVAGQAPQGTILISGISFGASPTNVFTFLQGVQIPISISKILSLVPTTPGTNTTSILSKLDLQSADINMKNPPSIGADIAIALLGYQFDAQLLLKYVSISAFLDNTPLATITVPGINLSSGNNQVSLSVHSLVNLASGSDIQTKVADIVNQIIGNGGSQNANLVVSNIAFGGSASSTFHILDKVKVSLPLAPYIQQLTGIVGGIIGGNATAPAGSPSLAVTQMDISATGPNDLSIAVGASIGGIGSKISVEMPYIGLQVTANGNGLVNPTINNLQLANGKVALTLALPFQPAAKSFISSLSTPVSQLMFSTVGTVSGSIVANNIKFGASSGQSFDIASKVAVTIDLNSVLQKAQAYINAHNPLHVNDMNTVLTTSGIQATIVVPGIPLGSLPLKMNFPISLSGYHKGNAILAIQATSMALTSSPWALGANINVVQPAFGTAMNSILPNVLEWKNALTDVTLGGVTLGSFTALQGLTITPPVVTLWSPINVPLNQLKLHLAPLGMDFAASFVNRGPMRVDMGTIDIMIKQGPNTNVLEIQNLGGPIHLNNAAQNGGNNLLALNASLKFNFLEFFTIIGALLNPKDNFQFVFSLKTAQGQPMPWLQDALNGVPDTLFANLLPILAKALQNVHFSI